MIGVGVMGGPHVEPPCREIPQEGRYHALPRIEAARSSGAPVHQHPRPLGQLDHDRIPLAHIEEDHPEPAVARAEPRPCRQRGSGDEEADRGAS